MHRYWNVMQSKFDNSYAVQGHHFVNVAYNFANRPIVRLVRLSSAVIRIALIMRTLVCGHQWLNYNLNYRVGVWITEIAYTREGWKFSSHLRAKLRRTPAADANKLVPVQRIERSNGAELIKKNFVPRDRFEYKLYPPGNLKIKNTLTNGISSPDFIVNTIPGVRS